MLHHAYFLCSVGQLGRYAIITMVLLIAAAKSRCSVSFLFFGRKFQPFLWSLRSFQDRLSKKRKNHVKNHFTIQSWFLFDFAQCPWRIQFNFVSTSLLLYYWTEQEKKKHPVECSLPKRFKVQNDIYDL